MKKNFPALPIALFLIVSNLFSQEEYLSAFSIPDSLKTNSNAVIRKNAVIIKVDGIAEMTVKVSRIVTVLNKLGNNHVRAGVGYDDNTNISKLSARIYDAYGKEHKKYSKGKFLDVSAVDGGTLYSDSRVKYLDFTPTFYPYTVALEYEYKTSSTGFVPNWKPIEGYSVSVQKSNYNLVVSQRGGYRVKEKNFENYKIAKSADFNQISYQIENLPAIKFESLGLGIDSFAPHSLVALNNFQTDGVKGFYSNWKEFGIWMHDKLLKDRASLPESTKSKVLQLVDGIEDPIERAKIVYQYVQDKTRYISVQVGIGGIQPIPASEVDKLSYGDCKGLTNYTKVLLDLVGVKSYYTHVEANNNTPVSLEEDFASLEQGNHVILNIPRENEEDIWLECTSQITPFGFLGSFTDNRKVLVIKPEGGEIKTTKIYKDEENLQHTLSKVQLLPDGSFSAEIKKVSKGLQYDNSYSLDQLSDNGLINRYKSRIWGYINNLNFQEVKLENNKDSIYLEENLKVIAKDFAAISNNDYLLRVNIFNRNSYVPKRYRNRKLPFKIARGFKDIDETVFTIPDGYQMLLLPAKKEIKSKFGTYSIAYKRINDKQFQFRRSFLLKSGEYPKEEYNNYRKFRRLTAKLDNTRIAITKLKE